MPDLVILKHTSKMDTRKQELLHILQFFCDKFENAKQAVKNVKCVYGPDTVTINRRQDVTDRVIISESLPNPDKIEPLLMVTGDESQQFCMTLIFKSLNKYLNRLL